VDLYQFSNSIVAINNISTIAAIACVLPTYFLDLRPTVYRLILSLGIVCAFATALVAISTAEFFLIFDILLFSPFVIVLIVLLASIKLLTRVVLWSTIVLTCVVFDWLGFKWLLLALS
jgi:hypothetical protein